MPTVPTINMHYHHSTKLLYNIIRIRADLLPFASLDAWLYGKGVKHRDSLYADWNLCL